MPTIVRRGIKELLRYSGYELVPVSQKKNEFIDCLATVNAACAAGLSAGDYVERVWGDPGGSARRIYELRQTGCLKRCDRVCEIGPGTGRYLEKVLAETSPSTYEFYETAEDWASWLAKTYPVVRQPTDGYTLKATPDACVGLVHAHGVFVYLSVLHAFGYFAEMIRVCAPQGWIVFDLFSDDVFDQRIIAKWLSTPQRYPVIIPYMTVVDYFHEAGFKLVHSFTDRYWVSVSRYLVFTKT